ISGTDLCLSSQAPRKFKDTVDIQIVVDNLGVASIHISQLQNASGDTVSLDLNAASSTENGNNTGGEFSFFSPLTGVLNGTYKNDANANITSFTANIIAKFSDDCTKTATITAKAI